MNTWIAASLLVVTVVGAFNLVVTVRRVPPPSRVPTEVSTNVVMRQEQRLTEVLVELRQREARGTIGYFSDLLPEQMRLDPPSMERYFLSQFALAPWVLDASSDRCEWAVADLRDVTLQERVPVGYEVVRDFGGGVFLLWRTSRL